MEIIKNKSNKPVQDQTNPANQKYFSFSDNKIIINYEDKKLITINYITDENGNAAKKPCLSFKNHQKKNFDIKSILKPFNEHEDVMLNIFNLI